MLKMHFHTYKCRIPGSKRWVIFWTACPNFGLWPRTSPKTLEISRITLRSSWNSKPNSNKLAAKPLTELVFSTETSQVQTGEITGVSDSDLRVDGTFAYTANDGTAVQYDKFGRTFYSHPSGQASDGSISLNVVNLQFVLSIGTLDVNNTLDIDLGGLQNFDPNTAAGAGAFSELCLVLVVQELAPMLVDTRTQRYTRDRFRCNH